MTVSSENNVRYAIDTCSLAAMKRTYPVDVFPGAWVKLNKLAESKILISTDQVLAELQLQDDEVLGWAKSFKDIFLPFDEEMQNEVHQILKAYPNFVDLKRRVSGADPFVVATAMINSCAVVTEEKPSGGPHRLKIPDICRAYNVECINVLGMLRQEGLKL